MSETSEEQGQSAPRVYRRDEIEDAIRITATIVKREDARKIVPGPLSDEQEEALSALMEDPEALADLIGQVMSWIDQRAWNMPVPDAASARPAQAEQGTGMPPCVKCGRPAVLEDSGDVYCMDCYSEDGNLSLATDEGAVL